MIRRSKTLLCCALLLLSGCMASRVAWRALQQPAERKLPSRITSPRQSGARLAALWVGHATVLVQMDDRFILTDPVFTRTVGEVSARLVEPGILPEHLPESLVVVVSHLHFDHLSYGSLELIQRKVDVLLLPPGGLASLPRFPFESRELDTFRSYERAGVRITAVPVRHSGGRFRIDNAWFPAAFTGYVIEYHGITVYFGGDTTYDAPAFRAARRHFPTLDLALLPICPMQPRSFMRRAHMDPSEALDAFSLLEAKYMLPIHFDTFINSEDLPGECSLELLDQMAKRGIGLDRVALLQIGEQRVFLPSSPALQLRQPSGTGP